MATFFDFVHDQRTDLPLPRAPADIAKGTYIVTGANTGLGFECVKHLFRMGAGRIILGVRSAEKGQTALEAVRKETGAHGVGEVWELDLMSLDSVEAFGKRLTTLDRLDAFIANAGIVMTNFQQVRGLEVSLLVNVLSTMLLSLRALPKLQESARRFAIQPRLVIVSSNTALGPKMRPSVEGLQGDVFDALSAAKDFSGRSQYPTTKLLQIYLVRQLASLFPLSESGVIVNTVNPGLCYTELTRNASFIPKMTIAVMRKLLARTAEEGSRTILQAAFAGPESHGLYCSECQVKDQTVPTWIKDETGKKVQRRVWNDLLKRLESLGYHVDVSTLAADRGSKAN